MARDQIPVVKINSEEAMSIPEVAQLLQRAREETGMKRPTFAAMINGGARNAKLAIDIENIERGKKTVSFALALKWLECCGIQVTLKRVVPLEDFKPLAAEPAHGGPAWIEVVRTEGKETA